MEFDIRENFVTLQYKNILVVIKETPRKYFIRVTDGYDFVPHIEVRFKDLNNNVNRWFVVPITGNFPNTVKQVLQDLREYFCNEKYTKNVFNDKIYERLSSGDFSMLNCDIITGIIEAYNKNGNWDIIKNEFKYP